MRDARVTVDSRIRVLVADVGEEVATEIASLFEHRNPKRERLEQMRLVRFDRRKEPRIIRTWIRDGRWLSLPRGGRARVLSVFERHGFRLRLTDQRTEGYAPICDGFEWPAHRVTLFADQRQALEAVISRETSYIRSPTASGKSTTGIAMIARLKLPAIVIVWTGALLDQWRERFAAELGIDEVDIGFVQGGTRAIKPITVAMQQTIARIPVDDPFFRFWGVVIADELARFSAPSLFACTDPFPARYRLGMSADERRADGKEFLAHDLFGERAIEIRRIDLVAEGRVRDVAIVLVPTGWSDPAIELAGAPADKYRVMLERMAESAERDSITIEIVRQELAKGEQVLVFSLRVEHCRKIVGRLASAGIAAGLMLGDKENRDELDRAVQGLRGGTVRVAVGTVQAIGTGVDLPRVGVGVVTMPIGGNPQLLGQVAGRLSRIAGGVTAARCYYLADPCRAKDWPKLFHDDRPVLVRDGEKLIDARQERKRARAIAYPAPDAAFSGPYGGDIRWRNGRA
jgi:superfamily II DNA or RNA helicase